MRPDELFSASEISFPDSARGIIRRWDAALCDEDSSHIFGMARVCIMGMTLVLSGDCWSRGFSMVGFVREVDLFKIMSPCHRYAIFS